MAEPRVTEAEVATSPIYRIKGQRSRWRYPDERLTAEHCEILRDVNISERGVVESRNGYTYYNTTQLSGDERATGLYQATFSSGTTTSLVVTSTAVFTDDGTTRADVTGAALSGGNDDRVQFVFLKDKVIINNGVDQVRTYDGAGNTADLTGMPWTKAKGVMVHKNLLFAWGTTEGGVYYPTRLRWCDINRQTYVVDITKWLDANRYEIYDGGPAIVGAVDNWGKALVFKEDGLYPGEIVYGQTGAYDFNLGEPRRGFSPVSKMSIVARPEFVFGAAREGAFVILPDMSVRVVTLDDSEEWLGLSRTRLQYAQAFVRENDHQIRVLVSSSTNTDGHDYVLVYDWEMGDLWIDRPKHRMCVGASLLVSGQELDWLASVGGYVYKGNDSTYKDDAGTAFDWRIKMSPNDLGMPGKGKHVLNIRTLYREKTGYQTVAVRVYIDEGRQGTVSGNIATSEGSTWDDDVATWNSGLLWEGGGAQRFDTFVNRICETITPEWTGNNPAGIEGYIVEYIPLES